jgi:pimeloyl-ACP methyl ester carboxylesterase
MPYATARDGTNIYYKDWGSGTPVVLIHGWPLTSDTFDDTALHLADNGFRAIFHDRRGFGRSDQPWTAYEYDTFADDVAAVLDSAGVDGSVALAGFSMGGGEVARFISRNPGRVSKAALIGSVVPFLLQADDNPGGAPRSVFDGLVEGIHKDRAAFFQDFFKTFFGVGMIKSPVSDGVLQDAWRQAMMAGLKPTVACVRAFSETDFRPDLPNFTMPTLIIHGTDDATVPVELTARVAAKAISQAQLIEYDGGPHGLFATHTERLARDLLAFLKQS